MLNAVDASEQQLAISMHLLVTSLYDKAKIIKISTNVRVLLDKKSLQES